jgi:hypothetical protein
VNIDARDVTIEGRHCTISRVLITSDLYSEPVISIPAWFTESLATRTLKSFGSRSFQLQGSHPKQEGKFSFATNACTAYLHISMLHTGFHFLDTFAGMPPY